MVASVAKAGTPSIAAARDRQTDSISLGMAKLMHLEVLNLRMRF